MISDAYDLGLSDLGEWIDNTMSCVQADINDLQPWYAHQGHFYERRYGLHGRGTNDPWPGASDINIPTIDKMVTQMKPMIVRLIMGRPQPIATRAIAPGIDPKKPQNLEYYLNSILEGISPEFSQDDFPDHVDWVADDCCQTGAGVFMVDHLYQMEPFLKEVRYEHLPAALRPGQGLAFTGTNDITDTSILKAEQEGVQLVLPSDFDAMAPQFEQMIVAHMDLDTKDSGDRRALTEIMSWLRKGMPNGAVAIHRHRVTKNTPRIIHVPREDIIVPIHTKALRDAKRITYRYFLTEEQLICKAESEGWEEETVGKILDKGPDRSSMLDEQGETDVRKKRAKTVIESKPELYQFYRVFAFKDLGSQAVRRVGGKNIPERVMLDVHSSDKMPVKFRRLPYDHQQWPFRDIRFEPNEPGYFSSRGIPEILDDLDSHRTAWHRHKENNLLIQTTTSGFTVGSGYDAADFEVYPGYIGNLKDPNDFVPLLWPQTALNIAQEEQSLDIMISSYLGTFAHDITADANLLEPRTATEVSLRNQNTTQVLDMRGRAIVSAWHETLKMFLSVAQQYAPERFLAQVTGGDPISLSASDIDGQFDVFPTATLEDMDPQFRMQKAMQRLQLLQQAAASGGDARFDADVNLAIKQVMDLLGIHESRSLMRERSPQEQQQMLQQNEQAVQEMELQASTTRKLLANQPVQMDQVLELLEKINSQLPHGEFQNIIGAAQAARQQQTDAAGRLMNGR